MVLYFQAHSRGKWMLSYEGPYIVKMFFSSGAMTLTIMNNVELSRLVNTDAVKKYFVKNNEKNSVVGRKPEKAA
jgi:hypothetical protein